MSRLIIVFSLLMLGTFAAPPKTAEARSVPTDVSEAEAEAKAKTKAKTGPANAAPDREWGFVDSMVEESLDEDGVPGATVSVVSDGEVVLERGYGSADAYGEYPMKTDTVFRTASQAKLFSTIAVLQLAAEGKVDLHTDVNRYLSGTRIEDSFPGKPVTLHHALTHTGGFDHSLTNVASESSAKADTLAEYVRDHQPPRKAPPGTVMAYDNYGFDLAALVVQQVSGQPYERYLRENLFEPLGMEHSTAEPWTPTKSTRTPTTGFLANGQPVSSLYSGAIGSGPGPVTSSSDMRKLANALLEKDPRLGKNVAAQMSKQQYTQADDVPGMGYGLQRKTWKGTDVLYKGGDLPGQHSAMVLAPKQNLAVFVMFHGDGEQGRGSWYPEEVARRIVQHEVPGKRETKPQQQKKVAGDVSQYEGGYRSATTSEDTVLAVSRLTSEVSVRAAGPGELVTTGLGGDPAASERRWFQNSPGHFVSADGYDQIAFSDGMMASTAGEGQTLERTSWTDAGTTGMVLLGFGSIALVVGWFAFSLLPLRLFRGKPGHPLGAKIARIIGWLAAGSAIGFLTTFVPVTMGPEFEQMLMLGSGVFLASKILTTILLWLIVICLPFALVAWLRQWWSVLGRVGYSVFVLGGAAFLWFAIDYNLILLPSW